MFLMRNVMPRITNALHFEGNLIWISPAITFGATIVLQLLHIKYMIEFKVRWVNIYWNYKYTIIILEDDYFIQ